MDNPVLHDADYIVVPDSWRIVRFNEVLDGGTRNGIYKSKEFHGRGTKIVNMGELFAYPRLHPVEMKRVELTTTELAKSGLESGDLLFARRSLVAEGAGKCSLVVELDEPTTFESSIIRARPDRSVSDPRYYYYYFSSPLGKHGLQTIRRQVAVAGITGTDLAALPVPLPPVRTQEAISNVFESLDNKIELNRRMNRTLEELARAIFKAWFVDFEPVKAKADGATSFSGMPQDVFGQLPDTFVPSDLGPIPEGWDVRPLSEITTFIKRGIQPKYLEQGGITVLNQRCIRGGRINTDAARQHDPTKRKIDGRQIETHDALVNSTGVGTLGRVAVVPADLEGLIVDSHVTIIRHNPSMVDAGWFEVQMLDMEPLFTALGEGSTGQTELSRSRIGEQLVVVPTDVIGEQFGKLRHVLAERTRHNEHENRTLAEIRDALLPKLVSGEIRVADLG